MLRSRPLLLCLALVAGLLAARCLPAVAQKSDKAAPPADKPAEVKPATAKAVKGTLKAEATLKGILEPAQKTEVELKLKAWTTPLKIKKIVPHGSAVKKGDVLVELDLEKIDLAIKDLRRDHEVAGLSLRVAEIEMPVLEKSLPLDMVAAERAKLHADEDLKKFLEVTRPQAEAMAEFSVKSATHFLEYAKEELRQLQKMYRSKDLTEETEEIILKRQRHQVESAEFMLKNAVLRRDQVVKVDMPRQEETTRDNAVKQTLNLEKTRQTLPLSVSQKRLALAKQKAEYNKSEEKLKHMLADREAMTVKAPADGVVYYGKFGRGQWTATATSVEKLHEGGSLAADDVFMTVVAPRPLVLSTTVEEKDVALFRKGLKGKATLTAFPELKLPAEVVELEAVPQTPGHFRAKITVTLGHNREEARNTEGVKPGMACAVHFVPFLRKDALAVPAGAVFSDDEDEGHYVYLHSDKGQPTKRAVKVGKTVGGKTEVLDGLKPGDEILTSKP
jgi:multidrug efflux pump subunit AcrA (membrane-fusion protein)